MTAHAQVDYPSRPLRLILGTGAGGGADAVARLLAEKMGVLIGRAIVVENKTGASGAIAAEYVAKSAPDGYTLLLGGYTMNVLLPAMNPRLSYDSVKDFVPVGSASSAVTLLIAVNGFPANNLRELVTLGRARSDLQYASWGNGSTGHFCGELLKYKKQFSMEHIPYKTTAQIQSDILGGHVSLAFIDMATGLPLVKAGRVKAIGSCTSRSEALPHLGSYEDEGIDVDGMKVSPPKTTMLFPAGTPRHIVDKVAGALKAAVEMPSVRARIIELGNTPEFMSGEELGKTYAADIEAWRRIAQRARIVAD